MSIWITHKRLLSGLRRFNHFRALGSPASGSFWEWFLLPGALFPPTEQLLPLLPLVLLLPASAPGGSHMSPPASLPLLYLAQAPLPPRPFLPAPTLSCCRSSEVTFLTRFCPKSLHLGKNSPSGACFDRRVKYCLF